MIVTWTPASLFFHPHSCQKFSKLSWSWWGVKLDKDVNKLLKVRSKKRGGQVATLVFWCIKLRYLDNIGNVKKPSRLNKIFGHMLIYLLVFIEIFGEIFGQNEKCEEKTFSSQWWSHSGSTLSNCLNMLEFCKRRTNYLKHFDCTCNILRLTMST